MCPSINTELHFDQNECQKTQIGGVLTLVVKFYIIYLMATGTKKMVTNHKPYLQSILTSSKTDQNYTISDLNNVHYALLDHKDKYYSLNETKRFIDLRMVHYRYTYNITDKKVEEDKVVSYSSLVDC